MKNYFLGLAANYSREDRIAQLFSIGRKEDCKDLEKFLERKYHGEKVVLTKNGRSALALTLKTYFNKGDKILVNGFTCYAVYEAVKAADLKPVFIDINLDDLNFDIKKIDFTDAKGIIIQNTFGNPIDIEAVEKLANENDAIIIEDLAHCAGVKYSDGREAGTVGAATILSFGKDKSIDTISGGAAIFRKSYKSPVKSPEKSPRLSDHLRARFYPIFGAIARTLTHIHLGGVFMKALTSIHWVEKSADSKLDLTRKISKFEARLALLQIKSLSRSGEKPLREFYFVEDRKEVLEKLKKRGFYFDGFWYEKPVSPARYYKKVNFPEKECKNAVYASEHIVNLPTIYRKKETDEARKIIMEYLDQ